MGGKELVFCSFYEHKSRDKKLRLKNTEAKEREEFLEILYFSLSFLSLFPPLSLSLSVPFSDPEF